MSQLSTVQGLYVYTEATGALHLPCCHLAITEGVQHFAGVQRHAGLRLYAGELHCVLRC